MRNTDKIVFVICHDEHEARQRTPYILASENIPVKSHNVMNKPSKLNSVIFFYGSFSLGIFASCAQAATITGVNIRVGFLEGGGSTPTPLSEFDLNQDGPFFLTSSATINGGIANLQLEAGETVDRVWLLISDTSIPGGEVQHSATISLYSGSSVAEQGPGTIVFDSVLLGPMGEVNGNGFNFAGQQTYIELSFIAETNLGRFVDDGLGISYIAIPEPQSLLFCFLPFTLLTRRKR